MRRRVGPRGRGISNGGSNQRLHQEEEAAVRLLWYLKSDQRGEGTSQGYNPLSLVRARGPKCQGLQTIFPDNAKVHSRAFGSAVEMRQGYASRDMFWRCDVLSRGHAL